MADGKKMRSEASTSGGRGVGDRGESVVIDVGRRKGTCGYCKSGSRTSISYGLWANSLTVDHYQALLDKGWRRSGCFLYRPEMEKTCCPSYTIRLRASDFVLSKEQMRVSKKMQRFLDGTLAVKTSGKLMDEPSASGASCSDAHDHITSTATDSSLVDCEVKGETDQFLRLLSDRTDELVGSCVKHGKLSSDIQLPKASVRKVPPAKRKWQADASEDLICSSNIAFQISSTLRRTNKVSTKGEGVNADSVGLSPKIIAEILVSHSKQLAESCGLTIQACNGHINFYSPSKQVQLIKETGPDATSKPSPTGICNDKYPKEKSEAHECKERKLEIRLKKSSFDHEEYSLYRKYQLRVHNDKPDHVTESSYRRFLVDSPLVYVSPTENADVPPCGFGSFHQQYLVDGKLIAVGVIDILPKCLSSKYLFWDPDLAFLSLGKYSALQEIKWVAENKVNCPNLQYYYLGYYIHSCPKMRYKSAYRPSELLCPLRHQWVAYDIAKPLLDRRKYVVLSDFTALQNGNAMPLNVIDDNMEEQENNSVHETPNDVFMDEDEMDESDSEDSDHESDSEIRAAILMEPESSNLRNVLIGLKGARLRYKDLRHAFDPSQRNFLERHLQRYTRAVGNQLSVEMVYSLG